MILNRLFLSEEYKQYLTFSVEISTNTLITQYSKHLWSDEQEHTHKRIKSLHDSGKGYRTIAKLLNAEGSQTAKIKIGRTLMSIQFFNDMHRDKYD